MNTKEWEVLVDEEIVDEIAQLRGIDVGTEEYKTTVDGLTKLVDRSIEKERLDIERKKSEETRAFENELKLKQMKEERIDRLVKNALTATGIISSIVLTVWGTYKTLRFEETGSITTTAGRKFTGRLFSGLK